MPKPSPGWIKLYRKITECEIWKDDDPFSKRDAWIDILLLCNYENKKAVIGMKPIMVEKGSFLTSQDHLAVRWHWSRQRVRSYIKLLEELQMITTTTTNKYTIIKVPKYEGYQGFEEEKNQQNNQQNNNRATNEQPTNNQQITTTKEYKEYKNIKNIDNAADVDNTKYIQKGVSNSYNPLLDIQKTIGILPTAYQAEQFLVLFEEVGEEFFHRALTKAANANARNYSYVASTAKGLAEGKDFDNRPQSGGLDFDAALKELKAMGD